MDRIAIASGSYVLRPTAQIGHAEAQGFAVNAVNPALTPDAHAYGA